MNNVSTRAPVRGTKTSLTLPNILTYARIAAIPVVVGCIFAQSILGGPLALRWVALAVFIAAAITDFLDGHFARMETQSHQKRRFRMAIQAHLVELERKHKVLETALHDALAHPSTDDARIAELKRRKLMVRDQIAKLKQTKTSLH